MSVLVAIGLGAAALAFVLFPLFRRSIASLEKTNTPEKTTEPAEQERLARSALQEVELDYQLGNVSDSDYQTLRERYMRRALVALKVRYDREQQLDDVIEERLRRMKEEKSDETNT